MISRMAVELKLNHSCNHRLSCLLRHPRHLNCSRIPSTLWSPSQHGDPQRYSIIPFVIIIMPPLLTGGGIKRCFCLTSVCRVHRA